MSINKCKALPVVTSILTVTNEKIVLEVFDDKYNENVVNIQERFRGS